MPAHAIHSYMEVVKSNTIVLNQRLRYQKRCRAHLLDGGSPIEAVFYAWAMCAVCLCEEIVHLPNVPTMDETAVFELHDVSRLELLLHHHGCSG